MNMNELELQVTKAYQHIWRQNGYTKWPVKTAGSEPTAAHFIAAQGLLNAASPKGARVGTLQGLAIAMYLRPEGGSNGQLFVVSGCAESKQNVRIRLGDGHHGQGGMKYLTTRRDGAAYVCELTAKGQKAVDGYIKAMLAVEPAKPIKATKGKGKATGKGKAGKAAEVVNPPETAPVATPAPEPVA